MNNDFKYPLIALNHQQIHIARNEKEILVCSKKALSNNFFKNMKIIDSSETLFNIDNAIKIKGHGLFFGYNIFLNRKLKIDLIVKSKNKININDFKKLLLQHLDSDFLISNENYHRIDSLQSIQSIICFLNKWYYNL